MLLCWACGDSVLLQALDVFGALLDEQRVFGWIRSTTQSEINWPYLGPPSKNLPKKSKNYFKKDKYNKSKQLNLPQKNV